MIRHPLFPSAVIFVAASVWGAYWIPLRGLEASGFAAGWAVTLFNAIPLLVLVPWLALQGPGGRTKLGACCLVGFAVGGGMAFYAMGLILSGVVRATMLFYLTPIWSTLIGAMWLDERIGWQRWTAIAVALTGMALLLSGGSAGSVPLNIGDAFALLSGVMWAFGVAAIRKWTDLPLVSMTLFQFVFAAGVAAVVAAAMLGPPQVVQADLGEALAIAGIGSVGFIMPSVLAIFWASKRLFPGRVGLLMMSEPMVAVISAWILLPGERLDALEWLGAALIVSACLLEIRSTRQEEQAA